MLWNYNVLIKRYLFINLNRGDIVKNGVKSEKYL